MFYNGIIHLLPNFSNHVLTLVVFQINENFLFLAFIAAHE
ncbi:hypothetical protein PALB_22650 [Pseudoalteromonas luteoviolacea B = ATCC 29581]|nr:hypothetical protein PALB_22650 [Pseudoalteromonas luteoviolacea B = ATCC 29581]